LLFAAVLRRMTEKSQNFSVRGLAAHPVNHEPRE
jgi:hypothetical protein